MSTAVIQRTNISHYDKADSGLSYRPATSNKTRKMLTRATELAKLSTQRHKHGSIIVKGGNVISVGVNRHKNDPAIFGHNLTALRQSSIHAEISAIKAAGSANLKGAVIYVARVNNNGDQMMSKPCNECQKALKEAGIKKVYFTIDSEMDI